MRFERRLWAFKPMGMIRDLRLQRRGRWILLSALIGSLSGLGAIVFDLAFRVAQRLLLEGIGRFQPPGEGNEGFGPEIPWLLPLSLVVGGLISGALVFWFAPEAEGHGTDAVIHSFHHLKGKIRKRVPAIKSIASAITIGSGGSAGREGPIAQIGAGIGSTLANLFKLTNHDRRIMMMAGTAGGIGAIFRAPLGAALFSAEILYSKPDFEYKVLLPGLISAITGYSIYSSYAGWGFLFDVPAIDFQEPYQLLTYIALGVLCAISGAIYPKVFYGVRDYIFKPMRVPAWLKPAIGALALGLIGILFPQALGMGYGYIQKVLDPSNTEWQYHSITWLLGFAGMKIVATSLTISSGGSGGVFGPSLVIGGALGAAFGQAAQQFMPGLAPDPAACILVGMGGFFAGVAKVPFASVIMVMELTGSYGLLVPSLLVAAISYLCLPLNVRLYENQPPSQQDSPVHLGSFAVDVMRQLKVRDCWETMPDKPPIVRESDSLASMVELAVESNQDLFPIVDRGGNLTGEMSLEDIRRALVAEVPKQLVIAKDLAHEPIGPLTPDDDLATAAQLLASRRTDAVTVATSRERGEVLHLISRRDLILAYSKEMDRIRKDDRQEAPGEGEPF